MPPTADSIDFSTLAVGDGDVVLVKCQESISDETARRLKQYVENAFPSNRVLVLGDGIDVVRVPSDARLERIESKLDALISALAEDDGDAPDVDLEGRLGGGERADGTPL